ncbi:putative membrane dehydrogenase protein [Paraphysoderma sedebokerense]|nr:putative membrane dehydrogenase protein [Paraphysoderma sedebokerense]
MDEKQFWELLTYVWLVVPIPMFIACMMVTAPYGRFARPGWGLLLNGKLAWFLQEVISPVLYLVCFLPQIPIPIPFVDVRPLPINFSKPSLILLSLWTFHYFNRSVIYTIRVPSMSPNSLTTFLSAVFFNLVNGYVNGRYVAVWSDYNDDELVKIRFWVGVLVWVLGLYVNTKSDDILMKLRKKKDKDDDKKKYFIPRGFLYEYISCPNYFGEVLEWTGYCIASNFSLPSIAFVILTFTNLFPRALSTHKWYQEKFKDYPKNRKAFFPFLI